VPFGSLSLMRILLLGKNGQVGWELQRSLAIVGEVVACDFDSPADLRADFTDPESLGAIVRRVRPSAIVNAAAHTGVDKAESEPERAEQINATAPGVLAREAAVLGAALIHYSTDYIFDGTGTEPRDEAAAPAPLSVYGQTKLRGEEHVRDSGCCHVILRTSWVYAARGQNFVRTMLRLASERDELRVIDDQFGGPTGADLLADVTAVVLRRLLAEPALGGTYHCVAAGETSWHGFARYIIEWARSHGQAVKVAPDRIVAVPTTAFPTPAARPLNSRLDTSKLRQTFDLTLPQWQEGVERMLTEITG
jgi:dTDP-4-dehydrorhamnose reductase